jgi:hypothetical protein
VSQAPPASSTRPAFNLALVILSVVLLTQAFFGLYLIQNRIDREFGDYRATEEILYVENGDLLKRALLGFESIAADLYWLRTVQYFGGKRSFEPGKRFDLLEPLLDITTSLDPQLTIAYSYGAIFLSEPFPVGAATPVKGIALVEKGIRHNPEHWRLYLDRGFIYFWYLKDYHQAAESFLAGSKIPGAPYWMTGMAGRALTRGGERQTARELWRALYETAENEQMRGNALVHLQQLDALDQIDALDRIIVDYRQKSGRNVAGWGDLIRAGLLPGVPADPTGVPYVLNPLAQKAEISEKSTISALP